MPESAELQVYGILEVADLWFRRPFVDDDYTPLPSAAEGQGQRLALPIDGEVSLVSFCTLRDGCHEDLTSIAGEHVQQPQALFGSVEEAEQVLGETLREIGPVGGADEIFTDLIDGHQHIGGGEGCQYRVMPSIRRTGDRQKKALAGFPNAETWVDAGVAVAQVVTRTGSLAPSSRTPGHSR